MSDICREECAPELNEEEEDGSSVDSEEYDMLARDETILSMMQEAEGQLCEYDASQETWWKEAAASTQTLRGIDAGSPLETTIVVDDEEISYDMVEIGGSDDEAETINYVPLSRENSLVRSEDEDEWVLSEILKRKRLKGVVYYQCLWKGYREPTWETHELLENEGWSGFCEVFERRKIAKQTDGKGKLERMKEPIIRFSMKRRVTLFCPERVWPGCYNKIFLNAADHWLRVTGIQDIVNDELAKRFLKRVGSDPSSAVVMCYHGTKTWNVKGIIEHGLVIPGTRKGVSVVNGSSMGVGIYTSRSLTTPLDYINGNDPYVFVVAVNVSRVFCSTTKYNGDWIVVFDEAQVLPVFLLEVEFTHGRSLAVMEYCDVFSRPRPVNPPTVTLHNSRAFQREDSHDAQLRSVNRRGLSKRDLKKQGRWLKELYTKGEVKHKK